jgi:ribokinase
MKYDVITFGSATQDIYLKSKNFLPLIDKKSKVGKSIYLPAGSKMKVDDIAFSSGGGGSNAAATFASLGLKVAYCGMVGSDYFGDLIIKELKKFKIDTSLIKRTTERVSNISLILSYPDGEKTILVYRGAADLLRFKNIPAAQVKNAKWLYLAPFAEDMAYLTEELVDFAKKNDIKVAMNPGYNQLSLPHKILERVLAKVDILILNQEEASLLTKIPYVKEKAIFKELDRLVHGICIMTKGEKGVVVSDGQLLYRAPAIKIKLVDSTGAGDSFNSGFLSGYIKSGKIEEAIRLGVANSASCLRQLGAKQGLLKKGQPLPKVKVFKEPCLENNLCQTKN